jgi:putative endonuclease
MVDKTLYKGFSSDYIKRLEEHNAGLSKYTSGKVPWILKYVEVHEDKKIALQRELMFKKQNKMYFEWLFEEPTNILRD